MKLASTVDLMLDKDYKERFKAEYLQLCIRLEKLESMIAKYKAGVLDFKPDCPIEVLEDQLYAMRLYKDALVVRAHIEKIDIHLTKSRIILNEDGINVEREYV